MLELKDITFLRSDEPIFAPVDLKITAGQIVLIEGRNGAGKTTLLKIIAGLLEPDEGEISWQSEVINYIEIKEYLKTSYLSHAAGFKDELTTLENLKFTSRLYGTPDKDIEKVLEKVGLGGYEYSMGKQLSAGQRKRLALARLLLSNSKLWLLDEPFSNLDQVGMELVNSLIGQHLQQGGMVIATSHGTFKVEAGEPIIFRLERAA
ncbi:MAG: heme ABC exporter ATP-binding protein CcmA [bacterium]